MDGASNLYPQLTHRIIATRHFSRKISENSFIRIKEVYSRETLVNKLSTTKLWNKTSIVPNVVKSNYTYWNQLTISQNIASLECTNKVPLADLPDDLPDLPIEILIGGDRYWSVVEDSPQLVFLLKLFYFLIQYVWMGI